MSVPGATTAELPASPAPLATALQALVAGGGEYSTAHDLHHLTLTKDHLIAGLRNVREAGLEMLTDIHGMDYLTYPGHRGKRFAVVYNVHEIGRAHV